MRVRKIVSVLLCLVLLAGGSAYAAAPAAAQIDQAVQADGNLSVAFHASDETGVVLTDLMADNVGLMLGGQALPVQLGPFGASGVGYVFAVSVSSSMTEEQFAAIRECLKSWIIVMGPQDMAAVVSIGSQVTTLAELTGDIAALDAAIDALTPAEPEAMLYSGIAQAADVAGRRQPGLPLQRAIVLVSDGRGSAADPVSAEQAQERVMTAGVPLYAAGAAAEDNADALAALGSMAQAAGGRMETGEKDALAGTLESLRVYIGSGSVATTAVPSSMADGSVRTLVLTVSRDGISVSDRLDIAVEPAGGTTAAVTPAEPAAEAAAGSAPAAAEPTGPAAEEPADDAEGEDSFLERYGLYIGVGCAVAGVALAAVILLIGLKKRRARKNSESEREMEQGYGDFYRASAGQAAPEASPAANGRPGPAVDTVALEEENAAGGGTVPLDGEPAPEKPVSGGTVPLGGPISSRLVLTDTQRRLTYSAQLVDRVTVGRMEGMCDIVLRDECVSARHCEIFRDGGRVRVRDMGSMNGTRLAAGGASEPVDSAMGRDIVPGDTLEIGNTKLEITSF